MNREIKFRGLDLNGNWVYGGITSSCHTPDSKTYIVSSECKEGFEEDERLVFIEVIPGSVGQYTGLKDNNGVEIYEGDVVKFSTRRYHLGIDKGLQTITFKSPVVFEDGCFLISEKNGQDTYLCAHENQIVIGNIHQQ